jgi:hypothetical protein
MWKPVFDVDVERELRLAAGQTLDLKDRGPYEVVATAASARKALAKLGQTVAVDVETDGINPLTTKMLCVGISDGKRTVVVHPPRELEDGWIATGLSRTVQDFLESTRSRENYDERRRRGGDVRRNRLQGM